MVSRKDTSGGAKSFDRASVARQNGSLQGHLLIAHPQIGDGRFARAVIVLCQHDDQSAMGVVINHQAARMNLGKLYETLDIGAPRFCADQPVHIGGPVESNRGFVLHTQDHMLPESFPITHDIGLTSSIEILRDITNGIGPTHSIVSLGCAGWHAGQLESELAANVWLSMPATSDLVFRDGTHDIWKDAYEVLGVDPAYFVSDIGRA
jgi:putative transcriptional regulator